MIPAVFIVTVLFASAPTPAQAMVKVVCSTGDEDPKVGEGGKESYHATAGRTGSRIRVLVEGDSTVFDIVSEFGIDKANITRKVKEWPKSILVRMHLGGLESFKARGKEVAVEWSVSSTGDHESRTSLVRGKRVAVITKESPYYGEVRIVGGGKAFPLKGGYFEVPLPAKLLEGNPEEITLEWVDFYRR